MRDCNCLKVPATADIAGFGMSREALMHQADQNPLSFGCRSDSDDLGVLQPKY